MGYDKKRAKERKKAREKQHQQNLKSNPVKKAESPKQAELAIKNIILPDNLSEGLTVDNQIANLNLLLGNYIDLMPDKSLFDTRPGDGTGTAFMTVYKWFYHDDDPYPEEYPPSYNLEYGGMFVDFVHGSSGEPDWHDVIKYFDTFEEAYRYATWLLVNAERGIFKL